MGLTRTRENHRPIAMRAQLFIAAIILVAPFAIVNSSPVPATGNEYIQVADSCMQAADISDEPGGEIIGVVVDDSFCR